MAEPTSIIYVSAVSIWEIAIKTSHGQVRLRSVPSPEAAALWVESPEGAAVQAAGPRVLEMTIESSGLGKESTNTVWFNPGRADVIDWAG